MDTIDSTAKGEIKENLEPTVKALQAKSDMNWKKGMAIGAVLGIVFGGLVVGFLKSTVKAVTA